MEFEEFFNKIKIISGEVGKYNQEKKLDIHSKGNQHKIFNLQFRETDGKFLVNVNTIGEWNFDKAIKELEFLKEYITELKSKARTIV